MGQNVFCLVVDVFPAVCAGLNRSQHMCYWPRAAREPSDQGRACRVRATKAKPASLEHSAQDKRHTEIHCFTPSQKLACSKKITLHCCQTRHKLPHAQGLIRIKRNEMWNSEGFEFMHMVSHVPSWFKLGTLVYMHQFVSLKAWSHEHRSNLSATNHPLNMLSTFPGNFAPALLSHRSLQQPPSQAPRFTLSSPDGTPSSLVLIL